MKNFVIVFLLLALSAGIYWLGQSAPETINDRIVAKSTEEKDQPIKKETEQGQAKDDFTEKPKVITRHLEEWKEEMEKFFASKSSDDKEAYSDYLVMQEGFREDRQDAYDRFMDEVRNEQRSFNITDLESGEFKKIQEEYLLVFEKRFGREVFLQYIELLDQFNDKLAQDSLTIHF